MNHKVLSHKESFNIILSKLRGGKPFTFTRFGDGDHIIMYKESLGKIVGGGNKFFVTPDLQREIIECYNVEDENFIVSTMLNDLFPHQMMHTESKIYHSKLPQELVERKNMLAMSCLFETLLEDVEGFIEFSKEMRKTTTMFVCNYNHENISKVYGDVRVFINVPIRNSYSSIDVWYEEILRRADEADKIILSAGFSSRVVAKRLWKEGVGKVVLDVGSLSDAFIFHTEIRKKIQGRKFMMRVEKRMRANVNILLNK